jgi:predicted DsbA family dithiol-disulfide isomerase
MTVTIDIVSDVICPWCFLGKRRLDKAIAVLDGTTVDIRWRPFLLDASIPRQGMPRQLYLERKFSKERIPGLHAPLKAAGEVEGIAFAFDKISVTPSTLDAHRLIRWAHAHDKQHRMAERLFNLYWIEGADIGKHEVLIKAAVDVGLDGAHIAGLLGTEADLDAVLREIRAAAQIGITGVPTFIFANRYAVVGAQPAEVLRSAIARAGLEERAGQAASLTS